MERSHIEQRAIDLLSGGYHCAESVLLAVAEACGAVVGNMPRVATCFGGGVGRSHEELCGALAGGLMALGLAGGRDVQGENWDKAAEAAARLRKEFIARYGASACKDVLAGLGEQENFSKCKCLSGVTAGLAYGLIRANGEVDKPGCCCETPAAAQR